MIILLTLLALLWIVSKVFAPTQSIYIEQTMARTLKARKVIFWKIVMPCAKLLIGSYLTWQWYILIHTSGVFDIATASRKIPKEISQHAVYGFLQFLLCIIPLLVVIYYLVKSVKGCIKTFRLIAEKKHNLDEKHHHEEEDFFS